MNDKTQTTEIIPVEIRLDVFVRIQGIPHDLSEREAQKISNVVMAMCTGNQELSDED